MSWSPVAVLESGTEGGALFPSLGDDLQVLPEPTDGAFGTGFRASAVKVERKVGASWSTLVEADNIDLTLFVTGGRIVFHCPKWTKGGGWVGFGIGGLAVAAAANAVAKGVSAHNNRGKVLAGHLRHEWVGSVGWRPKSFLVPAILLIAYRDGTDTDAQLSRVILQFKDAADVSAIARLIVDKAVAYWYASSDEFTPEQLANFETLRTSGLLPAPARGAFSTYLLPKLKLVGFGEDIRPTSVPLFPAARGRL